MDDNRLLAAEGRIAALEAICLTIASCLDKRDPAVRSKLPLSLERLGSGYDLPHNRPAAFVEAFTGHFEEIATKLCEAP